ncbi:dihydrolipoyl dehydrogenase family protein [Mesorhizobium sp. ZC-5]|uniref:dihydrolipoyl dehydrogenase family protein n=1 Tax=Mesorhizobium sp. ZC-5 TaxID=2986066 RepID=UPI0021E90E18|nr:FAD-dependent oxidoreductase [Mesorhizobium sp. ZC-5]MCV3239907.1 FAD-dependent oxidoreductase [Mesorhizobium sp. ZC-5]
MAKLLTPDICVIGAGSGGLSVAAAAAAFGVPVVLIEKGKMGGDCLNYGCVPSKAMLAAARHAHALRHGAQFGIADVEPDIDFSKVNQHIQAVVSAIAPNDSVERFTALGVQVIKAEARFKDARTVVAGDVEIRARRFVIATGSSPAIPPIPGLDGIGYLTNETLFEQTSRPRHLVVIGGGPVGLEMAQAHRRLGSAVTVIEAAAALGKHDPEMVAIVVKELRAEGVEIHEETLVKSVERRGRSGVRVHIESRAGAEIVDGTHLLVATGRTGNVAGLDLKKAGIACDRQGIKVTAKLRTTNRRVYAVGDVTGSLQFTHVAGYHAGLVVRALLFRLPARENRQIIPRVTFTDPELADVGLGEAEAATKHGAIRILRWPYAENDRAQAERRTEGHVKLVAGKRGRILGVSIVGANAGEMINMWALALTKDMTVKDVAAYVPPYPTMGEIGRRAAITYFMEATRKPLVRRVVRWLRVFG